MRPAGDSIHGVGTDFLLSDLSLQQTNTRANGRGPTPACMPTKNRARPTSSEMIEDTESGPSGSVVVRSTQKEGWGLGRPHCMMHACFVKVKIHKCSVVRLKIQLSVCARIY